MASCRSDYDYHNTMSKIYMQKSAKMEGGNLTRQSRVIVALKVVLMLLVVMLHVPLQQDGSFRLLARLDLLSSDWGQWLYIYVIKIISFGWGYAAVPAFFLFSGYYMFYKERAWWDAKVYTQEISKRIKTLLIPFVIFSLLPLFVSLLRDYLSIEFLGLNKTFSLPSWYDVWYSCLWACEYNFPLWYIQELFVYSLIAPIIYFIARRVPWVLGILFVYYINAWDVFGLTSRGCFFILLGAILGTRRMDMLSYVYPYRRIMAVLFVLGSLLVPFVDDTAFATQIRYMYVFVVIAALLGMGVWLDKCRPNWIIGLGKCTTLSFFVYVSHEIQVLSLVRGFLYRYDLFATLWGYLGATLAIVLVCSGVYCLLNRALPRAMAFALGQRQ